MNNKNEYSHQVLSIFTFCELVKGFTWVVSNQQQLQEDEKRYQQRHSAKTSIARGENPR